MMKKLLALSLAAFMLFAFAACNNQPATSDNSENTAATADTSDDPENTTVAAADYPQFKLGETASTDIMDFTMSDATLCYYAVSNSTSFGEPTDKDTGGLFAANTGTVYVSMTFTIKNKDRGASLNLGAGTGGTPVSFEFDAEMNGKSYEVYSKDVGDRESRSISFSYAGESKDGGATFDGGLSSNYILHAGETAILRVIGIIKVDPGDLNTPFDLTINLLNSSGEMEYFTYNVNK